MHAAVKSADGLLVRFDTQGEGAPTLVFVHGWSCDRRYWRAQVAHFAAAHRVVSVDLAGHGESELGRPQWTIPAFGADVAAVLDRIEATDAVLIGHSMGGDVIVETALLRPERVRALIWIDVYSTLVDEGNEWEELAAFSAPFHDDFAATTRAFVRRFSHPDADPALVEWIAGDMSSAPADVALDAMKHSFTNLPAVLAALPRLGVPVVAINPASHPVHQESFDRYGVKAVTIADVGHALMLEKPAEFNQTLAKVLQDL